MSQRLRGFAAALAVAALLVANTAFAFEDISDEGLAAEMQRTPVVLDALILRPVGLVMTAVGTVIFLPTAAIVSLTRPTDMPKPFHILVAKPFHYTFLDPLGSH